jgi:hypothetical protein
MPGWIQLNEDINYLQEGRDKPRAWKTLLQYNITHMVVDYSDIGRYALQVAFMALSCSLTVLVLVAQLGYYVLKYVRIPPCIKWPLCGV